MSYLYFKHLKSSCLAPASLVKSILLLSGSLVSIGHALPAWGVQINFGNPIGDLINSDSGNLGKTMTYRNAIADGSTNLDLVVEVVDSYSGDSNKNGNISNNIGQISIAANSSTRFKFSLVKSNTNNPHTISNIDFSLLDVDGNTGTNGAKEKVTLYSTADYTTVTGTPYLTVDEFGDKVEITATNNSVPNLTASTIPSVSSTVDSTNALTTEQEQHAIRYRYNNVSEFELGYGVIGG
jgi:hypothetical protein